MSVTNNFIQNDRQEALYRKVERIAERIKARKQQADREASLPIENVVDLQKEKYLSLTLPKEYGGEELSLYEFLLMQEKLAEGDGATALSVGWHLGVLKELSDDNLWNAEQFDYIAKEVGQHQKLINRCATEPATGSPTRGGIPETTAVLDGEEYIINGRKTFATMALVLDYYIVTAYVKEKDAVGSILIPKEAEGVHVEKTWDTLGMRGTGSDDLLLENVRVPKDNLVELNDKPKKPGPKGWLLHIPACYLGIALAARRDVIQFAKEFQPNSLNKPIAEVEHVRNKIGEIDLKLLQARYFLYSVADKWDNYPEQRAQLMKELGAVKLVATNTANEVVDLAMRVVGGRGLSKNMPFEQYYRDVRAGLHNPPMDDMVLGLLAKEALS
ncbi:acyl-CoA dehydrogenase family protein [Gracilibacillus sp. S3-1-1]|uniref:Acyl-CoA dehydrogenase family protein n=1 Tax=Gracilibacillus pellucidus TaxID=3095368 RepID=A0ACC6M193_9BACI|nr:acyl-CoA dehydrogenase family protein [Gracilibacillus sp. S3-1-1]MDX8044711.1 acyl-CoA dehydrogenase family protein [Gracilibacillus sp. S3-1-1]